MAGSEETQSAVRAAKTGGAIDGPDPSSASRMTDTPAATPRSTPISGAPVAGSASAPGGGATAETGGLNPSDLGAAYFSPGAVDGALSGGGHAGGAKTTSSGSAPSSGTASRAGTSDTPRIVSGGREDAERALKIQAAAKARRAIEDWTAPAPRSPKPPTAPSPDSASPGTGGPADSAPASSTPAPSALTPSERARLPQVPRQGTTQNPTPTGPSSAEQEPSISEVDLAALRRTADAMNRTYDISGFRDILKGAVDLDPDAAVSETHLLRGLLTDRATQGQLDHMLDGILAARVPTAAPSTPDSARPDATPSRPVERDRSRIDIPSASPSEATSRDPRDSDSRRAGTPDYADYLVEGKDGRARFLADPETGAAVTDLNGDPIAMDPDDADGPDVMSADMRRVIETLGALQAIAEPDGPDAMPATGRDMRARVRDIQDRYGEDSALSRAMTGALRASAGPDGGDSRDRARALAEANRLARDPQTFSGMRANQAVIESLSSEERAAIRESRIADEKALRRIGEEARAAMRRRHAVTRGEVRAGYGGDAVAPARQAGYDATVGALEKRYDALQATAEDRPGLPHPDLDPGLARELGHDAEAMTDGRERFDDLMVDALLLAVPLGAGAGAARLGASAVLKRAMGSGVPAAAETVELAKTYDDATRDATRRTMTAMGLDPRDPKSYSGLSAEQRKRIGLRAGIALLGAGASTTAARRLTKELAKRVPMPEGDQAVTEEALDEAFSRASAAAFEDASDIVE